MSNEKATGKTKEELLAIRRKMKKRKPSFLRQEWWCKKTLDRNWRKPRGIHSKQREHEVARGALPRVGYGSPAAVRGLNRMGYREVLVRNTKDMEKLNRKDDMAVIAGTVGKRKRFAIMEFAVKNNIKVANKK
ncbi:MAG: 50S ribosomal protein L32e [Candidatus Aenigmarchaeota archaeon]|nr:50S ribosomal protein L32e [Candidatus Aenigmarchaeota archaeon]